MTFNRTFAVLGKAQSESWVFRLFILNYDTLELSAVSS